MPRINHLFNLIGRISPVRIWLGILLLLVLLLAVFSRLQLPGRLLNFVTIEHLMDEPEQAPDSPANVLDTILLKYSQQLAALPLVRSALLQHPRTHQVKSFWLDACGVSQGDFYRFVHWYRLHANNKTSVAGLPNNNRQPDTVNREHRILGRIDIPANGVNYHDAAAYCRANNGRLPALTEYQAVATGYQGRLYPWGNQSQAQLWPYLDPVLNAAQKCGSQPRAAAANGAVHDLAHGMLEWADLSPENPRAALVGGGVEDKPHELYSLNFVNRIVGKDKRLKYAGFRCAYDQRPAVAPGSKSFLPTPWGARPQPVNIPAGQYTSGPPSGSQMLRLLRTTQTDEWLILAKLFAEDTKKRQQAFAISECEVTRRQYRYFLIDPLVQWGFFSHRLQPEAWDYRPLNWDQQLEAVDLPVVGLDWWSAYAFAKWAGGRLPTADEWRTAASAAGRYLYPWGPGNSRGFSKQSRANPGLQSCGIRTMDRTLEGVSDMAGNASEWGLDIARLGDGYGMTILGGNYMLPAGQTAKITRQSIADPEYRSMSLGLRIVRD